MEKAKRIFNKIISVISTLILIVSVVFMLFNVFNKKETKISYVGKYAVLRVITTSMKPVIDAGEYILVKKVDVNSLEIGDVITFISKDSQIYGQLNTHRIVDITNEGFVTKGDNNYGNDEYIVPLSAVQGKFVRVMPFITKICNIFSSPIGYVALILMPLLVIMASYMGDIKKSLTEDKSEEQPAKVETEEEQIKRIVEEMKKSGELDRIKQGLESKEK